MIPATASTTRLLVRTADPAGLAPVGSAVRTGGLAVSLVAGMITKAGGIHPRLPKPRRGVTYQPRATPWGSVG